MSAFPSRRSTFALLVAAVPLVFGACGRVPGQFEILNNQVPMSQNGGCIVPTNATVYMGEGTLDLSIVNPAVGTAYFVFPLIENNLPRGASSSTIDANQIQLSGFQVDIKPLDPSGISAAAQDIFNNAGSLTHFQVPWSGGIASGGGQLSAAVAAFPIQLAQSLSAAVVSKEPSLTVDLQIAALGTTNSGTNLTSDPFHFPVQVCSGCLVANVAPCPYTTAPTNEGNGCNPAQDLPIDCCTSNGALTCPPTVGSP